MIKNIFWSVLNKGNPILQMSIGFQVILVLNSAYLLVGNFNKERINMELKILKQDVTVR